MSLLQTLLALVVLIYVLCMVVQFLQEGVKAALSTKAKTMEKVIREFMGNDLLTPEQIEAALKRRGFQSLAALEHFSKEDFRQLMDTIPFGPVQLPAISNVLGVANASIDQFKEHAEAAYDAALAKFERLYTKKNKQVVFLISIVVVLTLNANVLKIYEQLSADQVMSQAIAGTAATLISSNKPADQTNTSQPNSGAQGAIMGPGISEPQAVAGAGSPQPSGDLQKNQPFQAQRASKGSSPSLSSNSSSEQSLVEIYNSNRDAIQKRLKEYPILLRWTAWRSDYEGAGFWGGLYLFLGLPIMGLLVSLGTPFWNDVLKSMTGVNNALNTAAKKSS